LTRLVLKGLGRRFGSVDAVKDVNLELKSGEFVSLLGPSGSCKSTTLNLLAGLLDADEGEIRIEDRIVNDVSPDKRDIAMVFQNYALYPHMTVFENIAFPLKARQRRGARADIEPKVTGVAEILGIAQLLHRYPRELSGGQQQRVALGRAMVRDPKVFLLDEPLSNLDARLRIRMRRDLKALHDRIRATIIYVTHDQAEAMSMSTRIAVFDKGRLQQFATPFEVYNRPANTFVANFVGEREILLIEARAAVDGTTLTIATEAETLRVEGAANGMARLDGRRVLFGARSEAVRLAGPDEPAGIPAVVGQVEPSGPDLVVFATTPGGIDFACRVEAGTRVARGDPVRLALLPERLLAFDPASGAAIALHD
jgi:ABC-type sugar transport system ATPase subunit